MEIKETSLFHVKIFKLGWLFCKICCFRLVWAWIVPVCPLLPLVRGRASVTLGARDFSCAVSGFGQVLKSDRREKLFSLGFAARVFGRRPRRPKKLLVTREKKSMVHRVRIDCLWQGGWSNDDDGRESVKKQFILRENRSLWHHAIWNWGLVRFSDDRSRKIRLHLKNWAVANKPQRVWKDTNSSFWGLFCSSHGIVVVAWASFLVRHLEEGDLLRASFDNLRDIRDQRGRIGHRA